MKRYINSSHSFANKEELPKNGKNLLLFQSIRKAIGWDVKIIEELQSCLLHKQLTQT